MSEARYRTPQTSYGRQSAVEEDNYEEDSYVSDTSPLRGSEQAPDRRRVVPASAEEYSEAEYEYDEYGEQISGLNQLLPTPRQGASVPPKKLFDPKQRGDLTKPCHIKYRGGDCDGSCGYSHSSEHMLERRDYFNRENVNSHTRNLKLNEQSQRPCNPVNPLVSIMRHRTTRRLAWCLRCSPN